MSGQNSVAGESSESAVDPTKSARGNLQDDTLITSSPRGKKKGEEVLLTGHSDTSQNDIQYYPRAFKSSFLDMQNRILVAI